MSGAAYIPPGSQPPPFTDNDPARQQRRQQAPPPPKPNGASHGPQTLAQLLSSTAWLQRDPKPTEQLLGDLIVNTTRAFLVGRTGLGKTLLGLAMAFAMATGRGFLHWRCAKPCRVLYIDGEMPEDLIIERLQGEAERMGLPWDDAILANLMIFSIEDAERIAAAWPDIGMLPPLNAEDGLGAQFIERLCQELKPDVVILDNVQSLTMGVQKEEQTWLPALDVVDWLTRNRIAQVWLDHTGHNAERQYGTAVKAWRFDVVGIMSPLEEGQQGAETAFNLSFDHPGKARRRKPSNWEDFAPMTIRLSRGQWSGEAIEEKQKKGEALPMAMQAYMKALLEIVDPNGPKQATRAAWLAQCTHRGLVEPAEPNEDRVTRGSRTANFRKKVQLLAERGVIVVNGDLIVIPV
jgi:hypothetical protein